MSSAPKHEILVVDDDAAVRNSLEMVLNASGYAVSLAEHGFDALLQLRLKLPAVIISDLNMPEMSGFEFLSVVRRRFPQISVIAMSGAYDRGDSVPGGVIADAFYPKGGGDPSLLLATVADLIRTGDSRGSTHRIESAPVWIPRNGKNSSGKPYVLLTCLDCLRSFPMTVEQEGIQKIQETACIFCTHTVRYIIDFAFAVASPKKTTDANTFKNEAAQAGIKAFAAKI